MNQLLIGRRRRTAPARLVVAGALSLLAVHALLGASLAAGDRERPVKVMTQNLYLGADLAPALSATNLPQLLAGAAQVYTMVKATDFPARAKALAAQIRDADPMVVGLQEVSKWRVSPLGVVDGPATAATIVTYDYLVLLQAELAALGMTFDVAVKRIEFDAEVPTALGHDVRLTQRDAILVRAGLPADELTVVNTARGDYAATYSVPVAGMGSVTIRQGWTSVDVIANGRAFRMINTHLDALNPVIRFAQSAELIAPGGPADTELPVVIVGDFNSGPQDPAGPSAYANVIAHGYTDAWVSVHPSEPGFTWGQAENLLNPTSMLNRRIDHVLFDAGTALRARLYGIDPDGRTPSGLWPSDHAGLAVALQP
jgi:endonuclease/exonuclease/phosphatase family metal-dependent hydrolase